ncbi:MAG: hypothetical protein ACKVUS_22350 [Saprospiraceae bacterium]
MDKILQLQTGQSLKDVNETLKIKPYDVVYSHDKGKKVLIYNYRVKDRRMVLPTKTADRVSHSESAQREGEVWYNSDYREVFVLFQDDKLKSIYGEEVLSGAGAIEAMESHLNGNPILTNNADISLVRGIYQARADRKKAALAEDEVAKRKRKLLIGGGAAAVLLVLNIVIK